MEIIIDDEVIADVNQMPRIVRRILDLLETLEDGYVYSTHKVASILKVTSNHINSYSTHPLLKEYKAQVSGNKNYYGNKKTIEELRKRISGEDDG